jgi:uncharacterized Ntn-hydrolase superfamily protein
MRRVLIFLMAALALPSSAFATWSVIAVDKNSGRVVIASATCVDRNDTFLMGVQAVVVPGKGVAACQAAVDMTHQNQRLVFAELQKGTDPARILDILRADPAFERRQFGIVDLQGRSAGHSGSGNGTVSQDAQGQVPGTDIYFSIQGNIRRPGNVVQRAVQAFLASKDALTDRVMAAMEAADTAGGDSRCSCPSLPPEGTAVAIPCDGRTAHVAYILMAKPADTSGDSHNSGNARCTSPCRSRTREARPGETGEPESSEDAARARWWRKTRPASFKRRKAPGRTRRWRRSPRGRQAGGRARRTSAPSSFRRAGTEPRRDRSAARGTGRRWTPTRSSGP